MSAIDAPAARRRRADAAQNMDALLAAAKAVFVDHGVDAPAKEITDLAGVGVGTLYRHFPRRADLIVAVLQHELDACVDAAEQLRATLAPWPALLAWIDRFTGLVATKRGLAAALHSGDPAYEGLPQRIMDRLVPSMQQLLDAAIADGSARADVGAREALTTVALICHPVRDEDVDFHRRMVHVFTDGLRRSGDPTG